MTIRHHLVQMCVVSYNLCMSLDLCFRANTEHGIQFDEMPTVDACINGALRNRLATTHNTVFPRYTAMLGGVGEGDLHIPPTMSRFQEVFAPSIYNSG